MATNIKPYKSLQMRMRTIHRVLGYLAVGMVMVYALSGITLIHRTGDFMKKGTPVEETLAPNLNAEQLAGALKMKGLKATNESNEIIYFADGQYNKTTGQVSYIKKEVVAPMNKFIDLHKCPEGKNVHVAWVTTIFGIVLFLLALTSLFMYKTSTKQFKTNMVYTIIGVVVTVALVLMV